MRQYVVQRSTSRMPAVSQRMADALLSFILSLITYAAAVWYDGFEALTELIAAHEEWQIDEILPALLISPLGLLFFAWRRAREVRREVALRTGAEEEARRLAAHDALTGLPNRRRLGQALEQALAGDAPDLGQRVALFVIDLDRFKPVNDLHGHPAGDRLLQLVAERLLGLAREQDTVARLGGDEFAMVVWLPIDGAGPVSLAARIVTALQAEFDLGGGTTVVVGASVGAALAPQDGQDAAQLLRQADIALFRAKQEGRGCFRFFESGMDAPSRERHALQHDLRQAIRSGVIRPYFQPLFELATGRLSGFEVLARWTHPDRGEVPPGTFIAIAEDVGLIVPLTEDILRQACRESLNWAGGPTIAVNLSPIHLSDRALPAMVQGVLDDTGFPAGRLELELTENALIANATQALINIRALKQMGVQLALDDFGTGYSSLSHLRTLPFDKIKIDASFIRSMACHPESRKIVAAVVGLGQSLGLPTVAEGIEDAPQAEALQAMGCNVGQGWLFGRAMPAAEAATIAAQGCPGVQGAAPALAAPA
jgi:diguanylate cyclase (GGDEF)-like protein